MAVAVLLDGHVVKMMNHMFRCNARSLCVMPEAQQSERRAQLGPSTDRQMRSLHVRGRALHKHIGFEC